MVRMPVMVFWGNGSSALRFAVYKQLHTFIFLLTDLGLTVSWLGLVGLGSEPQVRSKSLWTGGYLGPTFLMEDHESVKDIQNCVSLEEFTSHIC